MKQQREYSLDVLKFLATIIIVFHHYQQLTGAWFEGKINFYDGEFYWGYIVELFFLLSGYFTYKYIESINEKAGFGRFIAKKYIRFFPIMFICAAFCMGIEYIYYVNILEQSFPYKFERVVTSILGISRWLNQGSVVNNPTWYIEILLLCYIVFYITTYWSKKIKISPYILYIFVILFGLYMRVDSVVIKSYPFYNEFIARGYTCFFGGLLLRSIGEKIKIENKKYLWIELLLICLFIAGFVNEYGCMRGQLWYFLYFGLYPVIIWLFKNEILCRMFSNEKFRHIGGLSYNAFMWHLPVLRLLLIVNNFVVLELNRVVNMIGTTALIYFIGALSYFKVERKISVWIEAKCKGKVF